MANQKLENLLNLSLDATEEERDKSLELSVGYDKEEKTWEVIVKYSGSLEELKEAGIEVVELLGGFAILRLSESRLELLSESPQIEYIEKPKALFFSLQQGKAASCIQEVQYGELNLRGNGCLVAVIDSGERVIIMSS